MVADHGCIVWEEMHVQAVICTRADKMPGPVVLHISDMVSIVVGADNVRFCYGGDCPALYKWPRPTCTGTLRSLPAITLSLKNGGLHFTSLAVHTYFAVLPLLPCNPAAQFNARHRKESALPLSSLTHAAALREQRPQHETKHQTNGSGRGLTMRA